MIVLITVAVIGADSGPFDLYSDVDAYAVPFDTGVSRADLLIGYLATVPDFATTIKVVSTGACPDEVYVVISPTTTTTTTSTTSTTSTSSTTTTTTTTP